MVSNANAMPPKSCLSSVNRPGHQVVRFPSLVRMPFPCQCPPPASSLTSIPHYLITIHWVFLRTWPRTSLLIIARPFRRSASPHTLAPGTTTEAVHHVRLTDRAICATSTDRRVSNQPRTSRWRIGVLQSSSKVPVRLDATLRHRRAMLD